MEDDGGQEDDGGAREERMPPKTSEPLSRVLKGLDGIDEVVSLAM